jgi:uncharacterized protein
MMLVLLTLVFFGVIVLAMSVGVIFTGRCIRGSCGGQAIYDAQGEMLNCDSCPVRKENPKDSLGTRTAG